MKQKRKKTSKLIRRQRREGVLFLLPWILGFLIFFLRPMVESFWFGFNDVTMTADGLKSNFVGLKNFHFLLFEDAQFMLKLASITVSMLQQVVICTTLSLLVAVVLVKNFRGRTIYRAIMFLPIILTSGVVYSMIGTVANFGGDSNAYLYASFSPTVMMTRAGVSGTIISALQWLSDSVFSMVINCGVPILLYISALQKIPVSTYEAARIEGASSWDLFWKITIPKISPVIFLNLVYTIVDASTAFGKKAVDGIWLTKEAVLSTENAMEHGNVMMEAILNMGFKKDMKFGMSAAMSWMYFAVIALFLLLTWWLVGKKANRLEN